MDRVALVGRLKTYRASRWFCKPPVAGPVACARRGWVNSGVDELKCESCAARLLYPKTSSWDPTETEGIARRFSSLLNESHKEFCPWKGASCPPTLAEYPAMTPEESKEAFLRRLQALLELEQLPAVDPGTLHDMDELSGGRVSRLLESPETILKDLPEEVLRPLSNLHGPAARIFSAHCIFLALSEWDVERLKCSTAGPGEGEASRAGSVRQHTKGCTSPGASADKDLESVLLTCNFCGSQLGLWNFDIGLRKLTMGTTSTPPGDTADNRTKAPAAPVYEPSQNSSQLLSRLTPVSLSLRNTIAGGPRPFSPVAFPSLGPAARRQPRSESPAKRSPDWGADKTTAKRRKSGTGSAKLLEPLKQHRYFCPVLCAGAPLGEGCVAGKPGWVATLDHLVRGTCPSKPAPDAALAPDGDRPRKDARQAIELVRGLLG